jgi:hypothetical protein
MEDLTMPRIIAIHVLEPLPGASPEDYEEVVLESAKAFALVETEGWRSYIVKADRGVRKGKFAILQEFDSVEARNRYFPIENGEPSEETQGVFRTFEPAG